MKRGPKSRVRNPGFEPLEGRALLSAAGIKASHARALAHVAQISHSKVSAKASAVNAIMSALAGGAGYEFATLVSREVPNPLGVMRSFQTHKITQFSVPGLVFRNETLQSRYKLLPHDPLMLGGAGGLVLKGPEIELAALVRGPFTTYPGTTYIVFGINRGAGASLGPVYPTLPGITPDALVTVIVGPHGQNNSATVTDLTTGAVTQLSPSEISVIGPTVRVLVDPSQLPSKGLALQNYTFAAWAALNLSGGTSAVGSFAPNSSMIPIGVLTSVDPPTF